MAPSRASTRFIIAALSAATSASALAETPEAPEEFRALEWRFGQFEWTVAVGLSEPSEELVFKTADAAKLLQLDYLKFASSAAPEWRIAALYRAAYLMERLADDFEKSLEATTSLEAPQGFGVGEISLYRSALAERIAAARNEASARYRKTVMTAKALRIDDAWLQLAWEGAERVRPGRGARQLCHASSECGTADYLCLHGICEFVDSTVEPERPPRPAPMMPPEDVPPAPPTDKAP